MALAGGPFRLVDARTGTTLHLIDRPDVLLRWVIGYTSSAIYVVGLQPRKGEAPWPVMPGLWKVDPSTGAATRISAAPGRWEIVDGSSAWGVSDGGAVIRMDVATGTSTVVYRPYTVSPPVYTISDVVGLTGDGVLVLAWTEPSIRFLVVHPDGSVSPVHIPITLQALGVSTTSIFQDGATIFFSGYHFGIAAYDAVSGMRLLTTAPKGVTILGGCIPPS